MVIGLVGLDGDGLEKAVDGLENVGKKVGLVTGGLPEGLMILVGLVLSGKIIAGTSSMVVHVTNEG